VFLIKTKKDGDKGLNLLCETFPGRLLTLCKLFMIIIVKQGYIFPKLKKTGKLNIMALIQGATLQDTTKIPFKRIMRPMFPIDDI